MRKRRCSREDCYAPNDFCLEQAGPLHEQCEYFKKAGAAEVPAKITKKVVKVMSIPWTGEWLQPEQLNLLTHRGSPKIIGLVGSSGAGKTTYLAMLYSLSFNGKRIENWDFAGSYTLNGWELQAKTLRVQEDGTVRNPDATPSDKDFYSLLDIISEGWQQCWKAAIEQGGEVWTGISNPQETLFKILDHLLAGNAFSETLLNAISIGEYSSLKDYPQRASIWPELPEKARSGFVTATLVELLDDLASSKLSYNDLESELKKGTQLQKVKQLVISSKTIPLTNKLRLFDVLPGLGENHAEQLRRNHRFSTAEAEEFGQLVSKNKWKTLVDALYNERLYRNDLVPALLQSSQLLGFWQRLKLSATGLKQDAISSEEWWNEFLEIASKLFPGGPEQNGLWESAGCDLSQLYTSGSGREKWSHAIRILRNNGSPTVKKLVRKMREAYAGNEILKNLQDTLI